MILRTRTQRMAATQAQLNRRGAAGGVATTAAATPAGQPQGGWITENKQYMWSVLIAIAGAIAVYWGFRNPQIQPADVGGVSQKYWLALLICWGVGATLIWLNACGATAKTLQMALAGAIVLLLIGFPIVGRFGGSGGDDHRQTQDRAKREPQVGTLTIRAGVGEKSDKIPVPYMKKIVFTGEDFRYHCAYRDGREVSFIPGKESPCPDGDLPFVYAMNLRDKENVVAYAYAP